MVALTAVTGTDVRTALGGSVAVYAHGASGHVQHDPREAPPATFGASARTPMPLAAFEGGPAQPPRPTHRVGRPVVEGGRPGLVGRTSQRLLAAPRRQRLRVK
ncbi:hypothetical protein ACIBU0_01760 [Streptomyces sp. NPDC049627]|uniref:hypothetical protein n=1 Tax=Streptomyces sp. NPDC049627 TaxID=3365595 RepID=UPI0037B72BBC